MPFHTREFDVYVLLGNADTRPLWHWGVWREAAAALDPLVDSARGIAHVRSLQFEGNTHDFIKFGRITWDEKGHRKWCHGSPINAVDSQAPKFFSLEVCVPSLSVAAREGRAPDLFLAIRNEAAIGLEDKNLNFNPTVVLAIATDFGEEHRTQVEFAVSELSRLTDAVLTTDRRRPWGISLLGGLGYRYAICDLHLLFKPGNWHDRPLDLELFTDEAIGRYPSIRENRSRERAPLLKWFANHLGLEKSRDA